MSVNSNDLAVGSITYPSTTSGNVLADWGHYWNTPAPEYHYHYWTSPNTSGVYSLPAPSNVSDWEKHLADRLRVVEREYERFSKERAQLRKLLGRKEAK